MVFDERDEEKRPEDGLDSVSAAEVLTLLIFCVVAFIVTRVFGGC